MELRITSSLIRIGPTVPGEVMAMTKSVTLTYDYLCPFARNANEAMVEYVATGADVEVRYAPFSLHQNSRSGDTAVWDDPSGADSSGVRALLWSLAVREGTPESFEAFHVALFNARHDDGIDINDPTELANVARAVGLDADRIAEDVATGVPMKALRDDHTALVDDHAVFGVPTFISGDEAVFVRFMERHAIDDIARTIDMVTWTNLNEFKRTRIPK